MLLKAWHYSFSNDDRGPDNKFTQKKMKQVSGIFLLYCDMGEKCVQFKSLQEFYNDKGKSKPSSFFVAKWNTKQNDHGFLKAQS